MSDFDITVEWVEPGPATIAMNKKPAHFARKRLYQLIDGMITNAQESGEAKVEIRLVALNEQTVTENDLSAKSEEA